MTFADLVRGESLFVDANTFVFHFQPHPLFGSSCTDLLNRVNLQEFSAYTSTHVLGEVAHRLMTLEASVRFGWPTKIVQPTEAESRRRATTHPLPVGIAENPADGHPGPAHHHAIRR